VSPGLETTNPIMVRFFVVAAVVLEDNDDDDDDDANDVEVDAGASEMGVDMVAESQCYVVLCVKGDAVWCMTL